MGTVVRSAAYNTIDSINEFADFLINKKKEKETQEAIKAALEAAQWTPGVNIDATAPVDPGAAPNPMDAFLKSRQNFQPAAEQGPVMNLPDRSWSDFAAAQSQPARKPGNVMEILDSIFSNPAVAKNLQAVLPIINSMTSGMAADRAYGLQERGEARADRADLRDEERFKYNQTRDAVKDDQWGQEHKLKADKMKQDLQLAMANLELAKRNLALNGSSIASQNAYREAELEVLKRKNLFAQGVINGEIDLTKMSPEELTVLGYNPPATPRTSASDAMRERMAPLAMEALQLMQQGKLFNQLPDHLKAALYYFKMVTPDGKGLADPDKVSQMIAEFQNEQDDSRFTFGF